MKLTKDVKNYAMVMGGALLFALGLNVFIVPLGLYSGGVIGFAQILRTIMIDMMGIAIPEGVEIAGIINFILNLPLLLLAYKSISRKFFLKTLLSVASQTVFLTLIVIPKMAILDDVLAACVIGGLICGLGIGLTLRAGGSGGGVDILGVYISMKLSSFSVGKLGILINMLVFGLCAILFEIPVAIYSILYSVCMSLTMDRVHYQNINMTVMIFTKKEGIQKEVMNQMRRGVTYWKGAGAYTNDETNILVTVISKYEITTIKKIIHAIDPQAFVIINEGMSVSGNFEKRL